MDHRRWRRQEEELRLLQRCDLFVAAPDEQKDKREEIKLIQIEDVILSQGLLPMEASCLIRRRILQSSDSQEVLLPASHLRSSSHVLSGPRLA